MPSDMPMTEVVKKAAPLMKPSGADDGPPPEEGMTQLALFDGVEIRKIFHENEWKFSVIDVIQAITESDRSRKYWSDLKAKLVQDEGFTELSEKIGQLKLPSPDGSWRLRPGSHTRVSLRR